MESSLLTEVSALSPPLATSDSFNMPGDEDFVEISRNEEPDDQKNSTHSFNYLSDGDLISDDSDFSDLSDLEFTNTTKNIDSYNQINSNSVTLTSIPLFILTWNVNARVEEEENLREQIFDRFSPTVTPPPSTQKMTAAEEAHMLLNASSSDVYEENSKNSNSPTFLDFNYNNNYNFNNLKDNSNENLSELRDRLDQAFTSPQKNPSDLRTPTNFGPSLGITPEIVILGVQEMVELTTTSVLESTVVGQQCQEKLSAWQTNILRVLKDHNVDFELVTRHHMVGLAIFVFATSQWREQIKNIQLSSLPRGVGGVLGNKGAVYVRFDLQDSSICLVNAHFAAHQENVKKRNEDYFAIIKHVAFPDTLSARISQLPSFTLEKYQKLSQAKTNLSQLHKKINDFKKNSVKFTEEMVNLSLSSNPVTHNNGTTASDSSTTSSHLPSTMTPIQVANNQGLSANDHDVIIWFGDLNYRIDAELEDVYNHIDNGNLIELFEHDQLHKNMEITNSEGVFDNFFEPLISFPPTYQYIPDVGEYDRRKDKKMRIPAWCDRILWRVGKKYSNQISSKKVRKLQNKIEKLNKDILTNMDDRKRRKIEEKINRKIEKLNLIENESRNRSSSISSQTSEDPDSDSFHAKPKDYVAPVFANTLTETIEVIQYTAFANKISDHRPVGALLNLKVKKIDWMERENKFLSLYSELLYDVDPQAPPMNIFRLPWISCDPHTLKIQCYKKSSGSPEIIVDTSVEDSLVKFCTYEKKYCGMISDYLYSPASIRVHNHSSASYCFLHCDQYSSNSNFWIKLAKKFSTAETTLNKRINRELGTSDTDTVEVHIIPPRSYKDIPISVNLEFALQYYGEDELQTNPPSFILDFDASWHSSLDAPLSSSCYEETLLIPIEVCF